MKENYDRYIKAAEKTYVYTGSSESLDITPGKWVGLSLTALDGKFESLESNVGSLGTNVEGLQSSVGKLQYTVDAITTNVNDITNQWNNKFGNEIGSEILIPGILVPQS